VAERIGAGWEGCYDDPSGHGRRPLSDRAEPLALGAEDRAGLQPYVLEDEAAHL
jgi:hypothetical protein